MDVFRKYLLPGFIFQSVIIGGGYGTGRELVEFFLQHGPLGGLIGMAVATAIFSLILAICFELARITRSYDYRHFLRQVLGRGWFAFEIPFLLLLLIILAVLGAASGDLVNQALGWPPLTGTVIMFAAVGLLAFYGTRLIEGVLSGWSFLLYGVYVTFFILCWSRFGGTIGENIAQGRVDAAAVWDGLRYAGYSLAVMPAILFSLKHIECRRQAIGAGLLAGLIGMLPAGLFFVAMTAFYPEIQSASLPATLMLERLDIGLLTAVFQLMLFGTFIETGVGLIHSFNERLAGTLADSGRSLPQSARPAIALALLVLATFPATMIGLVDLIARGYGYSAYVFLAVFVVPVMTVGVFRIVRQPEL